MRRGLNSSKLQAISDARNDVPAKSGHLHLRNDRPEAAIGQWWATPIDKKLLCSVQLPRMPATEF
jgi:hypothetical protein